MAGVDTEMLLKVMLMFVKPEPGLLAVSSACAVVCTADCQLYKRGWMFECY